MIISARIDVTKIDKSRLYKGDKGTYLDVIITTKDQPDQYGNNGMVAQSVSKEERVAGTKGAILGNIKIISGGGSQQQAAPVQQQHQQRQQQQQDDDIPF